MKIRELLKKPVTIAIIAAVVGVILGLIWAWGIQPVKWKDASPSLLHPGYQEDYLRMAIDSYQVNNDATLATRRYQALGLTASTVLATIASNPGNQSPAAIMDFYNVVQNTGITITPTPTGGQIKPFRTSIFSFVIIAFAVMLVGVVFFFIFRLLRPKFNRSRDEQSPAHHGQEIARQTEMTDFANQGEEQPVAHFITTYVMGDDLYDESEGINSADGEFLGECGVGISETIAVLEKPKRVSAFEIWLFDKKDIQTVTKVLMSEHAYKDAATFQRLQAKGEPVLVLPGQTVELETKALKMRVKIAEAEYGGGAPPEGSYFDRMTLELAVWPKNIALE